MIDRPPSAAQLPSTAPPSTSSSATAPRARKSEQLPAEDTIVEVAPNILRLQLPADFTGLGHVNMYTLIDERGIAVVDPGLPGRSKWNAIPDRLRAAGFKLRDVHTVIVTHSHPDHFGGAGRLAVEAGADIVTHAVFRLPWDPGESDLVELMAKGENPDAEDEPDGHGHESCDVHRHAPADEHTQRRRAEELAPHMHRGWTRPKRAGGFGSVAPWGGTRIGPPLRHRLAMNALRLIERKYFVAPVPTLRMADGEVIKLAGRDFFAVHTPGHTADHLCLHDPEGGVLLSGDHVLPSITPHVAGIGGLADPLDEFVASLDRVASFSDVKIALPAHGVPFTDVAGRVAAIKQHHAERLEQVRQISRQFGRAASVAEFSHELFSRKHWGHMAESETYAHLEHLRHGGQAECRRQDDLLVYEVA